METVKDPFILIIGVGGAGGNIVRHIYDKIENNVNIDFLIVNTDKQALLHLAMPLSSKLLIGESLTGGNGTGADPQKGENAALESAAIIKNKISRHHYRIAFIITGMGGGTGTGASPVIAKICQEADIYTIAICSTPFSFEGILRQKHAANGITAIKKVVDNVAIFSNDNIINLRHSLTISDAFSTSDDIFYTPVEIILSLINSNGIINIDFADILTTLKNSKLVTIAHGSAQGEKRITHALNNLQNSPFLQSFKITEATRVLINIHYNTTLMMCELNELSKFFDKFDDKMEIVWGATQDNRLSPQEIKISAIIAGIENEKEIIEYSKLNEVSIEKNIPKEIEHEVAKIKSDYKDQKIAFIIMKFGTDKFYNQILENIKTVMRKKNIAVLRADDKEYHTDLYYNILSYIYAADFGIAVFERISDEIYNPNVAFEVGYMTALNKPICLLKEKTLKNLPTDIIGKLYKSFDLANLEETLDKSLSKWMNDREI